MSLTCLLQDLFKGNTVKVRGGSLRRTTFALRFMLNKQDELLLGGNISHTYRVTNNHLYNLSAL